MENFIAFIAHRYILSKMNHFVGTEPEIFGAIFDSCQCCYNCFVRNHLLFHVSWANRSWWSTTKWSNQWISIFLRNGSLLTRGDRSCKLSILFVHSSIFAQLMIRIFDRLCHWKMKWGNPKNLLEPLVCWIVRSLLLLFYTLEWACLAFWNMEIISEPQLRWTCWT